MNEYLQDAEISQHQIEALVNAAQNFLEHRDTDIITDVDPECYIALNGISPSSIAFRRGITYNGLLFAGVESYPSDIEDKPIRLVITALLTDSERISAGVRIDPDNTMQLFHTLYDNDPKRAVFSTRDDWNLSGSIFRSRITANSAVKHQKIDELVRAFAMPDSFTDLIASMHVSMYLTRRHPNILLQAAANISSKLGIRKLP